MGPAAGFGRSLPKNLYVRFVDQCGWLERVIRPLSPQLVGGQAPKVVVEKVEKPAFRGSIPFNNSLQQLRHFAWSPNHRAENINLIL
jgi:hypothetical protein